jgi:uncharacterized protein
MGERTRYTAGTFSWTDLSTSDPAAAKAFYSALFGWELTDMPAGDGDDAPMYSMAAIDGKWVSAIAGQPPQQRDAGVPPMWNSYITVADIDAVAARAQALGATMHAPPFDVMQAGRMAVIQDPQGAWFELWQPNEHIGAGLVNAPGALAWNELGSPDVDGSAHFYGELLGWTTTPMEGADPPYLVISNADGHSNGGIRPPAPPGTPPLWLVYFAVADIGASATQVTALGGTVMVDVADIGIAKIAVAQDPQGAVFALYDGTLDP